MIRNNMTGESSFERLNIGHESSANNKLGLTFLNGSQKDLQYRNAKVSLPRINNRNSTMMIFTDRYIKDKNMQNEASPSLSFATKSPIKISKNATSVGWVKMSKNNQEG